MGKSFTYHIIGEGTSDATGSARIYPCMNKREMAQAVYTSGLVSLPIVAWSAQTKTGARWLGMSEAWITVKASSVRLPRLVDCPACVGRRVADERGIYTHCPVCNSTGKTTPGYEKKWAPWQIEEMQKRVGLTD